MSSISNRIIRQVPVIRTAASFVETYYKVTNATTIHGDVGKCIKGVVLNCTPPVIKYPALCAALGPTSNVF